MRAAKTVACCLGISSALLFAACSSPTSSSTTSTTSSPSPPSTTTTASTSTTQGSSASAVNLPVTDAVRQELINAGAAVNNIPPSQYTGLAPGLTYYAVDKSTNTYWAAARLVPGMTAADTQAQIASQDQGSYYLFKMPSGGTWTAYADGQVGPSSTCPKTVPPANVVSAWGWAAGSCWPPSF